MMFVPNSRRPKLARSDSGEIAKTIVVAHPEQRLEMGCYKNTVKVVAEERSQLYSRLVTARIPQLR